MKLAFTIWIAVICLTFSKLDAQDIDIPLNSDVYHYIDRIDIKGLADTLVHTDIKPYSMDYVGKILARSDTSEMRKNELNWHNRNRFLWDDEVALKRHDKGILKAIYRNERDLYHYKSKNFKVYVNPVLYLSIGGDLNDYDPSGERKLQLNYRNTRGGSIRGSLFNKIGFYTELSDNQAKYPIFIKNTYAQFNTLWGEGFMKVFDTDGPNFGFDYFNVKGYLTYSPFKNMRLKLGKDRVFWGNGYQSLFISDHATDYFFLNINTRLWIFEYTNHFAQMIDYIPNKPDPVGTQPKKYTVFHQLSVKPWHFLSLSVFESVVYSPTLPGGTRGFEIEYLNPIIFYRSVEQFVGSPDNSMLGFSFKANFLKRFQAYGQLMIDDFNWRKRNEGKGYFGNKVGYQLGLKYIDAFWIPRLDLQFEYNRIRPYTYQHFNPSASYAHYNQYLAHSMGANLHDFNLIVRYQPWPHWNFMGVITYLQKGLNQNGINYGGDPLQSYINHPTEFNNFLLQGERLNVFSVFGKISYQLLRTNVYAEIEGRYRRENGFSSISAMGSIRANIPNKPVRF